MRKRRRARRQKKAEKMAWSFTGAMFLLLAGIILFHGRDMRIRNRNDEYIRRSVSEMNGDGTGEGTMEEEKSKKDNPVYLDNLNDIQPGTVLTEKEIDLTQRQKYFTVSKIGDDILQYINGKSYIENDNIGLDDLRYLKLLHYNYNHQIQVGEMIVNKKIAEDVKGVFQELFSEEYEIESMYLIEIGRAHV